MKLKIYAEESYTTTVTRMPMEIDTDNYPELNGMTEDEISDYIDKNVWDMAAIDKTIYSSLGEELSDQDVSFDDISNDITDFYIESI
jgi:hypothetical protein